MAAADDFMQLQIGQIEEAPGLSVRVILQAQGAQDRILESNRDRRSGGTHLVACLRGLVFGARKCSKAPVGILFEEFCPAFEALASRGKKVRCLGVNVGNGIELVNCLVFHGRLLFSW
jgi:hypothetical protein